MIVALHGFTGCAKAWDEFACYVRTRSDEEVRTPSLLGHGAPMVNGNDWTFAGEVDRLAATLPVRPCHLVGYSMGARLVLAIAVRYPERLSRLTLVGGQPGIPSRAQRDKRVQRDNQWCELLLQRGIEAFVDAWQKLPLWESQRTLPAHVLTRQRQLRLRHEKEGLALALNALGTGAMPPMWNDLSTVQLPVDLVVGERDERYVDIAHRMLPLLAAGTMHVVANVGHNVVLEAPETLAAIVLNQETP